MLKSGNAWEVVTLVWLQTTAHFAKKANRIVQQVHLSLHCHLMLSSMPWHERENAKLASL